MEAWSFLLRLTIKSETRSLNTDCSCAHGMCCLLFITNVHSVSLTCYPMNHFSSLSPIPCFLTVSRLLSLPPSLPTIYLYMWVSGSLYRIDSTGLCNGNLQMDCPGIEAVQVCICVCLYGLYVEAVQVCMYFLVST